MSKAKELVEKYNVDEADTVYTDLIKEFDALEKLVVTTRKNMGVIINKGQKLSDPRNVLRNLQGAKILVEAAIRDF